MDDFGYKLIALNGGESKMGEFFVRALPKVIKALTVIGTIAMLLVAGGIFIHNSHFVHDLVDGIPFIVGDLLIGFIVGTVAVTVMLGIERVKQ
jgi:predicted DNA repair protein MutK